MPPVRPAPATTPSSGANQAHATKAAVFGTASFAWNDRAYKADAAGGKRIAYVSADLGMIFQSVRQGVLAPLKQRYGGLYGEDNVLLSATHTHSGPGGHSHHLVYNLSVLGFRDATYRAIVDGIVESVAEAHDDLRPGTLSLGPGPSPSGRGPSPTRA